MIFVLQLVNKIYIFKEYFICKSEFQFVCLVQVYIILKQKDKYVLKLGLNLPKRMFFTGARSPCFFLYKGHSCRVSIKSVWDNERHIKGIWGAHKTTDSCTQPLQPSPLTASVSKQDAVIMPSLCTECECLRQCLYSLDSLAVPMVDALKKLNVFEEEAQTDPLWMLNVNAARFACSAAPSSVFTAWVCILTLCIQLGYFNRILYSNYIAIFV